MWAQQQHTTWSLVLVVSCLFLCSPATQAQSTRTLVEELGVRVDRLEQIVQGQALLELLQRIETLSALSREQRGELDVLRRELETLRQQQRDVIVDQERRLAALEQALDELRSASRALEAASNPSGVGVSGASMAISEDGSPAADGPQHHATPNATAPVAAGSTAAAPTTAAPAISADLGVPETAEVLYARALASLNAGAYPAAIAAFEVFLQRHREHSLVNNVRYWMGQAYFLLRDYTRALEFFAEVAPDTADVGKVADAWLKRGLCEIELGRSEAARQSLETVAARYPDSAAAPLARQTLARLAELSSQ